MVNSINEFDKVRLSNATSTSAKPQENAKQVKQENTAIAKSANLRDEFVKEKRKNGLVDRFYNWVKNTTNLGLGPKKIDEKITLYEQGQIDEANVREDIKKYRNSQNNAQQILGDAASLAAGMTVYSKISNTIKLQSAKNQLGGNMIGAMASELKDVKYAKHVIGFFKNMTKTKRIAMATAGSAIVGAFVKKYVLKFNRLGSKEYKSQIDPKENKFERKYDQRALNRERRKANWKNFFTGGLNGIIAPLANLAGGIAGVPLVIAANLGTRYVQSQKDKDGKASVSDFAEKFKDNAIMNTAAAALIAAPLIKKANYNKVLGTNIEKVVTKLKDAKLKPAFDSAKTAYTELQEMLIGSDKLTKIIHGSLPDEEKIVKLIDENIFAAKFIQNADHFTHLARVMKENCPPSRTLDEAKNVISKTFGSKYEATKLLGVGTVAESYLAKNTETGKEVVIKLLKNGIDSNKINADKQKLVDLVKSKITDQKQLQYYLNNIDDLASGIGKEVDLKNEMESASRLVKFTKEANIVKPLEIKDNIYVMEKAPGISLKTLQDVSSLEARKNVYETLTKSGKIDFSKEIANIEKQIKEIKAKSPDFDQVNITPKEIDRLLSQYIKVQAEQFDRIYKNGKTLHGDIHPGNVFVDLKALKSGQGKAITLIDTGNVIDLSMGQARSALKLNEYVKRGNVKDIADYVTDGAILPENMTKDKARETVEKELRKVFFDTESELKYMNNDSVLALTANIMKKHNIIPASTQLNLERAKHHAKLSLNEILESFMETKYSKLNENDKAKAVLMISKDLASWGKRFITAKKVQEAKNMTQYPLSQIIKSKNNPNMLKTNSEDYLTYKFKQGMNKSTEDHLSSLGG